MQFIKAAFILVFALSCKPPGQSDLKTLENFASADGNITINKCSGTYPLSKKFRVSVSKGDYKSLKAVRSAARALPPGYQKLFFEADGGHIFATKNFKNQCGLKLKSLVKSEQDFFQGGLPAPTSCARVSVKQKKVVLQFKPDPKMIQHQFVRVFGLNYTRLYGPRRFKDWNSVTSQLAAIFTKEVALSKGKFSLAPYQEMFSTETGLKMYSEFVFGEAFDSYYCSNKTRKSFAKNFPESFLAFGKIANRMEQLK
jgi:hypothetical protein